MKRTGRKPAVRHLSMILSFSLLAAAAAFGAEEDFSYPEKKHEPVCYADLPCTGVETDTMTALASEVKALSSQAGNEEKVRELCDRMIKEHCRQAEQYTLLMNKSAADFSDETLSEMLEDAELQMDQVYDIMMEGLQAAAQSYGDAIEACFPDESWLPYIREYEPYSEEESSQRSEETGLELAYYAEAGYDVIAWVDGDEWSFERYNETEFDSEEEDLKVLTALYQASNAVLGEDYRELVRSRASLAKINGYENYAEYAYKEVYDRDYTREDLQELQKAVKEEIVPVYQELEEMVSDIKPEEADTLGGGDFERVLADIRPFIGEVSPFLEEAFDFLQEYRMYDADTSSLRRSTGYTVGLPYHGTAMIFDQMTGDYQDYFTAVHEFGHFNTAFHDPAPTMFTYSVTDVDETQSQGLELLFMPLWEEVFPGELGEYLKYAALCNILNSVLDGMAMEEFEQTVYTNPDMSLDEINELRVSLLQDYGIYGDETDRYYWTEITHLFDMPFYYTSYATSALAALEIWMTAQTDPEEAVREYLDLTNCHGEYYFLYTLEMCGIEDPLQEEEIRKIAEAVRDYLSAGEILENAA